MLNSRDVGRLRPDVASNCRALLAHCRAEGLPVLVTGTVRALVREEVQGLDAVYRKAEDMPARAEPTCMATNISTNPEVKKAATRGVLGAIGSALGGVLTGGILGRPSSSGGSQAGKGSGSSTSTPSSGNYYISSFDKNLSKGNSTFAEALPKHKDAYCKAYAAGDSDGMNLANQSLENLRLIYGGYLGGVSGSDYDVRNPHTFVGSGPAFAETGYQGAKDFSKNAVNPEILSLTKQRDQTK